MVRIATVLIAALGLMGTAPTDVRQLDPENTLVIETTHFNDETSLRGSDHHLRVIERLWLEGADALRYEFTIDNPTAFTRPWSGALTLTRTSDRMYEFACHEANYGLPNMLQAARYEERKAAERR